jgi:pilus assembly protein CpaF
VTRRRSIFSPCTPAFPARRRSTNSADDALSRLATLPLLAGRNIDAAFVQPAIATGVHLVVHCRRGPSGERFIEEVIETTGRIHEGVIDTRVVYRRGRS